MKNQQKLIRFMLIIFFILFIVNLVTTLHRATKAPQVVEQDYTSFITQVKQDKIQSVTLIDNAKGPLELKITPKTGAAYNIYATHDSGTKLTTLFEEHNVKNTTKPEESPGFLETFFFTWGPTIFFLVAWIFVMKKMGGGAGGGKGLFNFGKSKAQLIDPDKINVTFKDVVGCDEAKIEAQEFVDFLKNPDKFSKLGGRTPRGLLLTGPAGTGKTMLAKALAKESGVPFFSISGSEFVEMFVGVGAARVRDMFETAKKVAPCVLFIDEIDAIGGKRGGNGAAGGGHDEREQTLNQILVELDGMDTNKGIILVGATNRPEILDKALLRPGRIDRQIVVALPDVYGREGILKVHSKDVPLTQDLSRIARGTPGFSGAELANLVNESAIFAARRGKKFVDQKDFEDAKDKIMMGPERPSLAMDDVAKRDTGYHESGHAVIARLVPQADPVYKVTIIPRGQALGVTMQLPEQDRYSHTKQFLMDKIAILMGGRAAEEVFCNTFTTGASNDIEVATNIATNMVMTWGMSDLGPVALGDRNSGFLGQGALNTSGLSQETLHAANLEVRNLINEQYARAKKLLDDNRDIVEAMTEALMEVETIEDWQIENLMHRRHYNDDAGLVEMKSQADAREKKSNENRKRFDKAFISGAAKPAL
jgi:cell division protease FtsH